MSNSSEKLDKGFHAERRNKTPLINPNSDEQVMLLMHLLLRARAKKLDIFVVSWNDQDLGECNYLDYFDLPQAEVSRMIKELDRSVELS